MPAPAATAAAATAAIHREGVRRPVAGAGGWEGGGGRGADAVIAAASFGIRTGAPGTGTGSSK
ncbi:hypothetical protein GCM10010293_42040 [Streptomyces griseoflavus]|nr:hypothetical protein GCM10010293_42040 [Streptomyces griseoflavus]